ncbi:Uncharacterised protein [uncultured Clostridium sp.]|nr:Uncharacterised protein [uncultured Clostridium sp.]
MAKQVLPTNFMDDILNESMNGKRRWTITQNDDGTYTLEDATTYDQLGNTFGQAQVNEMNKAINESVDQARVIDDYKTLAAVNQNGFVPGAKPVAQLISDLGGCSLEQENGNFYIVGADSVRKKLGNQEFAALDCGGVAWTAGEFGQWHHGYHFTKVSEIPNFGSMIHGKDFFIEVYNGGTEQLNAGIGVSYVKHSDSELVMTSVNGLHSLNVRIYYAVDFTRPAPSSFIKSIDFTIASGTTTKNILLADIPDAGEIVCAGLVSRGWEGWNALNVTYTTESVTITFSTSNNSGHAFGSEVVRVWYR